MAEEEKYNSSYTGPQMDNAFAAGLAVRGTAGLIMSDGSGNIEAAEEGVDYAGAVHSHNGYAQLLVFTGKTVATTAWASSVDYADYPWAASVSCSSVTADYVADVIFSPADADSGNFAPVAVTGSGIVKIYAAEKPTTTLTIPTIKCEKAVQ